MSEGIQSKLEAVLSRRRKRSITDPSLTPAGVLLLIYRHNGEPCLLLTRRTQEVQHHKGEVSFPGGIRDARDASLLETALRETQEELGIAPEDVTVLGELDDAATWTGFVVHTFVGTIPAGYSLRPNATEIAEVIGVPLAALLDPNSHRVETRWIGGRPVDGCSFVYRGHLIWGATAAILRQLVEALEASGEKGSAGEG